MIREKALRPLPGLISSLVVLAITGINFWQFINAAQHDNPRGIGVGVAVFVLTAIDRKSVV